MTKLVTGALLLTLVVSTRPASANLISNGGFEDAPYTIGVTQYMPGWDVGATAKYTNVYKPAAPDVNVHSGAASYKTASGAARILSQPFSTVAGNTYAVSFWVRNSNLTGPATVSAFFDSTLGGFYPDKATLSTTVAANTDWTHYIFYAPAVATATETFLEIQLQ